MSSACDSPYNKVSIPLTNGIEEVAMPLNELFPNSTVKQVIFQIRYPNLFYIESKIGDFQLEIIEQFPESSMVIQKPVVFADLGSETKIEFEKLGSNEGIRKVWRFTSPKNFNLNVQSDSLDITSNYHKTYNNPASPVKFRDIIEFVTNRFFKVLRIPLITRIGLRYIDECPLPAKDNETYNSYFNSGLNLSKYDVSEAFEMDLKVAVNRDNYSIRYIESLQQRGDQSVVILDFDAFARSIEPNNCLVVADQLHDVIINEFTGTVKEPVYEYMRRT